MEENNEKKHKILVIDDDLAVCQLTSRFLSTNNTYHPQEHHVEGQFNPDELAKKYAHCFDVLVIDFEMPSCNGITLAETFRKIPNNTIKGYILHTARARSGPNTNGLYTIDEKEIPIYLNYLQKPYHINQLLSLVEKILCENK